MVIVIVSWEFKPGGGESFETGCSISEAEFW